MNKLPITLLLSGMCVSLPATELIPEKEELLKHKATQIEQSNKALRYDWLSPLRLGATYHKDKSSAGEARSSSTTLSASYAQDLFRSGGICYAIRYADAKLGSEMLALEAEAASYQEQIFSTIVTLRRDRLRLEQSSLRLENSDIEIFLKRRQYEAGDIDITLLNRAIMDKNSELKTNISLKYSIADLELELQKYTAHSSDNIVLPTFIRLDKSDYLAHHRALAQANQQAQMQAQLSKVVRTNYLPTISFDAQAGYGNYDYASGAYDGGSYGYGLTLSMPIDFMETANVEASRAAELVARAEAADMVYTTALVYNQHENKIAQYEELIDITRQNLTLYDDLIEASSAGVDAGYKTGYDLQILRNSKQIDELEIRVNDFNIQLELAALHFTLLKAKEN